MYGEEVYAGQPQEFSPVSESAYSAAASVYGMLLSSTPWQPAPQSGVLGPAAPPTTFTLRLWPGAPFSNATFFRLRADGALLVSATRANGQTLFVSVEADLFADASGAGLPVNFTIFCPDWADGSVDALSVVAGGVGAVTTSPVPGIAGQFFVTGLTRGLAASFYPTSEAQPAFTIDAAEGRNASEFNAWGSRFVYKGELP